MKSNIPRIISFCLIAVLLVAATVYGSVVLFQQLKSKSPHLATACTTKSTNHTVTITNSQVIPSHTTAKLCDTLTVTNTDDVLRYIAFGRHDEHQAYDGITEKTLEKGKGFTVTLDEVGDYKFHDHLHDEVIGTFSVER